MKSQNKYFVTEAERRNQKRMNSHIAWYVWVLLIALPPVGIFLLWKRESREGVLKKVIITVLCLMWSGPWVTIVSWHIAVLSYNSDGMAYREYLQALTEYIKSITK